MLDLCWIKTGFWCVFTWSFKLLDACMVPAVPVSRGWVIKCPAWVELHNKVEALYGWFGRLDISIFDVLVISLNKQSRTKIIHFD